MYWTRDAATDATRVTFSRATAARHSSLLDGGEAVPWNKMALNVGEKWSDRWDTYASMRKYSGFAGLKVSCRGNKVRRTGHGVALVLQREEGLNIYQTIPPEFVLGFEKEDLNTVFNGVK